MTREMLTGVLLLFIGAVGERVLAETPDNARGIRPDAVAVNVGF